MKLKEPARRPLGSLVYRFLGAMHRYDSFFVKTDLPAIIGDGAGLSVYGPAAERFLG